MTWLKEQLKKIESETSKYKEEINAIRTVLPDVYNEFQEWTPLKLIFLHYVMAIYTAIMSRSNIFKNIYYVDLFAGSGINKTRRGEHFLIGSPFIATLNHRDKYRTFFLCEPDKTFVDALTKRLEKTGITNARVIPQDCNGVIDEILGEMKKTRNNHALFFIDPFAMEFRWESFEKVLKIRSDVLFVFMTSSIFRAWKAAEAQPEYNTKALNSFYGDASWKAANCESDLLTIFKSRILSVRCDGVIESVEIKGKGFHYEVIFITNKTKHDNPWLKGVQKAKKEIERNSSEAVKNTLEVLSNKQSDLESFFK
jgi:three-Cys-motif partner protein